MVHNISMVSVINIHESTTWTTRTNRHTTIWVQFSQSGEKISRSPYWHSWVDSTDFRLVSFSWFPQWIFMNLRLMNILDDWYQAVVLDNPPKKSRTLLTFLWKRRSGDVCFTCWNGKAIILWKIITPAQLCPSPLNPGSQEQLNNPSVFVQVALSLLQLWVFWAHSSMSAKKSTQWWVPPWLCGENENKFIYNK